MGKMTKTMMLIIFLAAALFVQTTISIPGPKGSTTSCSSQTCKDCLGSCNSCNQCTLCIMCLGNMNNTGLCKQCGYCKDGAEPARKHVKRERSPKNVKSA